MMAGTDLPKVVKEFEHTNDKWTTKHHERALGAQRTCAKEVAALTQLNMVLDHSEHSGEISGMNY